MHSNSNENLQDDAPSYIFYDTETRTETRCPGASSDKAAGCHGTIVMSQSVLHQQVSYRASGNFMSKIVKKDIGYLFYLLVQVFSGVVPTEIVLTGANPTAPTPQPTTPTVTSKPTASKPSMPGKPTQAPQPSTTEKPTQAPQLTLTPAVGTPNATVPVQQFATCGQPQPKKTVTRIFGGLKVPPGAAPWQVSLQMRSKNSNNPYRHICGGVLIESCWVLTAGHCM